ncbi:MAG TPA: prolyl oligopeptidase family serine peptidase, partial [Blastocatellia bacterium]|nr:prolyl oligopeptidase family serine peptidase [Blastocatellia bacterium]
MNFRLKPAIAAVLLVLAVNVFAQEREVRSPEDPAQRIRALEERLNFLEQTVRKDVDDLMWFQRMGDIAVVDKVSYTGPPPRVIPNPTGQGAGNPVIIRAYTFLPKGELQAAKLPLIVFVHGGVHGDFSSGSLHIVRELIAQGYAVIAPDYRGSSGYGRGFWQLIDYGGLENDDVLAGKRWMIENHPNIDPLRVGI